MVKEIICIDGKMYISEDHLGFLEKYRDQNYYVPHSSSSVVKAYRHTLGQPLNRDELNDEDLFVLGELTDFVVDVKQHEMNNKIMKKKLKEYASIIKGDIDGLTAGCFTSKKKRKELKEYKRMVSEFLREAEEATGVNFFDIHDMTVEELIEMGEQHDDLLKDIVDKFNTIFRA